MQAPIAMFLLGFPILALNPSEGSVKFTGFIFLYKTASTTGLLHVEGGHVASGVSVGQLAGIVTAILAIAADVVATACVV
jgi:hypothetical protein